MDVGAIFDPVRHVPALQKQGRSRGVEVSSPPRFVFVQCECLGKVRGWLGGWLVDGWLVVGVCFYVL